MFLKVLQIVAAAGTIATGLVSLIAPKSVTGFTGLIPNGGRGITEIRSILGGFFVALGVMPLLLGSRDSYLMLGVAYLVVAAVRIVSMFADKSVERSNVISAVVEVIFGVILVL